MTPAEILLKESKACLSLALSNSGDPENWTDYNVARGQVFATLAVAELLKELIAKQS